MKRNPQARPPEPGTLPKPGADMLAKVYEETRLRTDPKTGRAYTKTRASEIAWGVVKKHYYKRGEKWHARKRALKKGEKPPRESNPKRGFRPPSEVVNLGTVLDVALHPKPPKRLAHKLYSWSPRPILNWARMGGKDVLFWVDGEKATGTKRDLEDVGRKVLARARRWSHYQSDGYRELSVPDAALERVGVAEWIGYRSDKFRGRKMRSYQHDFTSDPVLFRGRAGSQTLFVLRGGRLRVTSRGIEG